MQRQQIVHEISTVNPETYARVLFSRNFAYAKFRENKILAKWRNHCHSLMKVNHVIVTNMSFNAICENNILAKISKFTVDSPKCYEYETHEIQQDNIVTKN